MEPIVPSAPFGGHSWEGGLPIPESMRHWADKRRGWRALRSDRGQTLILFVLMLPVLLGFAGLVVDGAHALAEQRMVQNAADAAALAASQDLEPALHDDCDYACMSSVRTDVSDTVSSYSEDNGGASSLAQ